MEINKVVITWPEFLLLPSCLCSLMHSALKVLSCYYERKAILILFLNIIVSF